MKLKLWRNATLVIQIGDKNILIDPMLGAKGSLGKFPMTDNELLNPLVDLPFSEEELKDQLSGIDAVAVTHLHPDHWDPKAVELLDKNIPLICPEVISEQIAQSGFKNIISVKDHIIWENISISITEGQHGTGEIGEKMGEVNGFVFKTEEKTLYIVGDSIWYERIAEEIDKYRPQHIVVAGGAATFAVGDPIIMTSQDIIKVCEYAPEATVLVTHLEAVSHCKEDRKFIQEEIIKNGLQERCFVVQDGEEYPLD
ncbi:MBL fold metallo-hydrolase [Chryseobacterium carnipullorum]|uniref:MBL fold metallo-hydrolase n=1 Tax=Chryseobacterium carnipullorum TaxID=1124835 RepID=A0A1M7IFW5_CHRCU|nr:MBL fold metallo-hydrolase [Chryseobacterium carnipullorum]AZA50151.1 MBL fold metallo-hydrolase [Chryseobacterium carnipullorum]AZA65027.1 MBL fold metallo-hydrolase [Chryseobacterium carnipullorum]SHM39674.1 L-ascorbate metabolism protein UlaG, beta-lactamase superfamily [Chryseobacterium carnipullorum]STC97425.1 metal-dependent hydrolase [Chryseobacterium carnipullorum]